MNLLRTPTQTEREKLASWLTAIVVALLCIVFGSTWVAWLRSFLPIFESVNQITGSTLSWPMRFLLATHSWLLPLFFYCTAVMTIVKEGLIQDWRKNRIWNATIFAFVTVVVGLAHLAVHLQVRHMLNATGH